MKRMADSLLAHLYSRIRGSQEDVATVALNYIIDSSDELNRTFNKLLSDSLKIPLDPDIRYKEQSVGENRERPDLSGKNKDGNEVILCEMKFYAGLTDNQPYEYIERLKKENGKALVFVCPNARRSSLWGKLIDLCIEKGRLVENKDTYCVTVDGIAMAIVTWGQIIDALRLADSSSEKSVRSDIEQLAGFCNMMDQDAFIPFSSEELGPETARKEMRFYILVDELVDKLGTMKELRPCKKGKQNPWRSGYGRKIDILDYRVEVIYDRDQWKDSLAETPLWIVICGDDGKQPESLKKYFTSMHENVWYITWDERISLALTIKADAMKDEVVDDLIRQIIRYIEKIPKDLA